MNVNELMNMNDMYYVGNLVDVARLKDMVDQYKKNLAEIKALKSFK